MSRLRVSNDPFQLQFVRVVVSRFRFSAAVFKLQFVRAWQLRTVERLFHVANLRAHPLAMKGFMLNIRNRPRIICVHLRSLPAHRGHSPPRRGTTISMMPARAQKRVEHAQPKMRGQEHAIGQAREEPHHPTSGAVLPGIQDQC